MSRARRSEGRRLDPVLLLSFAIPVLTVAALATVSPSPTEVGPQSPASAPLRAHTVVCPGAVAGADVVQVAVGDAAAAGPVRVFGGDDLTVRPGAVSTRRTTRSVVLRGRDAMAPGLLAARGGAGGGTDCRNPESDVWFPGVGAGPEHSSVLRMANPDAGPALADVMVLDANGLREVARLRGVAVEPRGELALDLSALVPAPEDVTLHVTVSRGRLASWIVDRVVPVGGDDRAETWLPPAAAPGTDLVMPGVGRGGGERILALANTGGSQATVEVRAVTPDGEFVPQGLPPVQVAPGATVTVDVSRFLRSPAAAGLMAFRLESSEPVTAALRTRAAGRMTHAVTTPGLRQRGALLVDAGPKRLVLAGAQDGGEVRILQRAADGRALRKRRVQVLPDRGARVPLADGARYVEVVVGGQLVSAAVESGDDFSWVRPVRELVTETWVPYVSPALY